MRKILIVEDDISIQKLLKTLFQVQAFKVFQAYSVYQAVELLKFDNFDIALVDVMLGDGNGFEFSKDHLNISKIPYIFLTAVDDIYEKIEAINMGADDYIEKPFEPLEVLARVNMVLRRNSKDMADIIKIDNIEVDVLGQRVHYRGEAVELTNKEFGLLNYFINNRGRVLSRDIILEEVWGYDFFGNTRTVDMHVKQLRKKLDLESIKTVYKIGYRME